jgi:hypothetical protein
VAIGHEYGTGIADCRYDLAVHYSRPRLPVIASICVIDVLSSRWHALDVLLIQARCVVREERGISCDFPEVPHMCERFGVPRMNILFVPRAEGWLF